MASGANRVHVFNAGRLRVGSGAPSTCSRCTLASNKLAHALVAQARPSHLKACKANHHATADEGLNCCGAFEGGTALALFAAFAFPACAHAQDVTYNAAGQSEFITNVTGVLYVGLVAYFLYKVFTRRAAKFTSERIGGASGDEAAAPSEAEDPELTQPVRVTPVNAFLGVVQAGAIAAGLFVFATKVDTVFESTALPDQYTARNISITVRTIIRGLVYLAAFVFGANSIGLAALTLKLLIFGDDEEEVRAPAAPARPRDALPKVGLTSDIEDIMKAFDEASTVEKKPDKRQP